MKIWQGENDLCLFKASMPINQQQVWQAFYRLHKEKIQIKKEKIAVEKIKIIINATFKLSNRQGFALMSLRDLSKETEISMGSLYAYIGSKNQLAEMIHQFLPHMFEICLGDLNDDKKSYRQQLYSLIRGHIFITECLQQWFFFAFMEAKYLSRATKELAKKNEIKTQQLIERLLIRGREEKCFADTDTDSFLTSMAIKSLLQNWYLKRNQYRQAKTSCEEYILFIEQLFEKQLGVI